MFVLKFSSLSSWGFFLLHTQIHLWFLTFAKGRHISDGRPQEAAVFTFWELNEASLVEVIVVLELSEQNNLNKKLWSPFNNFFSVCVKWDTLF